MAQLNVYGFPSLSTKKRGSLSPCIKVNGKGKYMLSLTSPFFCFFLLKKHKVRVEYICIHSICFYELKTMNNYCYLVVCTCYCCILDPLCVEPSLCKCPSSCNNCKMRKKRRIAQLESKKLIKNKFDLYSRYVLHTFTPHQREIMSDLKILKNIA